MVESWLPSGPNIPTVGLIKSPYHAAFKEFVEWAERESPIMSPMHASPEIIKMNVAKFSYMAVANSAVNRLVVYRRDVKDKWRLPREENGIIVGDCEDYSLGKMKMLVEAGWPRGALRLTICDVITFDVSEPSNLYLKRPRKRKVQRHAVLQIETDHGTWVLDNRFWKPRLWERMIGYVWLCRELPGTDDTWELLRERRAGPYVQREPVYYS